MATEDVRYFIHGIKGSLQELERVDNVDISSVATVRAAAIADARQEAPGTDYTAKFLDAKEWTLPADASMPPRSEDGQIKVRLTLIAPRNGNDNNNNAGGQGQEPDLGELMSLNAVIVEVQQHLTAHTNTIAHYNTSQDANLLQAQQALFGPCLLTAIAPSTLDIGTIAPLFLDPIGDGHVRLLYDYILQGSVLIFNATGAGKTKFAYSLCLSIPPNNKSKPPIVMLVTVGVPQQEEKLLSSMFDIIKKHCSELIQKNVQRHKDKTLTDEHLKAMDNWVTMAFKRVALTYLLVLEAFAAVCSPTSLAFAEKWLRFQQNGGRLVIESIFTLLLRVPDWQVRVAIPQKAASVGKFCTPIFFYDEVGALADQAVGCCFHIDDEDVYKTLTGEITQSDNIGSHAFPTDLLYALRVAANSPSWFYALADADQVLTRQIAAKLRSPTLGFTTELGFVYMGVPEMMAILNGWFTLPENASDKLQLPLWWFSGRVRLFYDFLVQEIFLLLRRSNPKPQTPEAMLELILHAITSASAKLEATFLKVIRGYINDKRPIETGVTRSSVMEKCFVAICMRFCQLRCNGQHYYDLVTGGIITRDPIPSDERFLIVDLYKEPIVLKSILGQYYNCGCPVPDQDPFFQYIFQQLATRSVEDSAKGDLCDQAVAWAYCRIAWFSKQSLGVAFRSLVRCTVPETLNTLFLANNMLAGSLTDLAPSTKLADVLMPSKLIEPDSNAGMDRATILIDSEGHVAGFLASQSKARTEFDGIDAILTLNPMLAYCSKTDRRAILMRTSKVWDAFTTQNSQLRSAIADKVRGTVVRVLFSVGGFPDNFIKEIEKWNTQNPEAPIIPLQASPDLFGPNLYRVLHNLVRNAPTRVTGSETVYNYFSLSPFPKHK